MNKKKGIFNLFFYIFIFFRVSLSLAIAQIIKIDLSDCLRRGELKIFTNSLKSSQNRSNFSIVFGDRTDFNISIG